MENNYLPSDLLREILCKLPVKSLLRFRCVSKMWCSLIDSPDFISMHRKFYPINCAQTHFLATECVPRTIFNSILTIRRTDTLRKTGQLGGRNSEWLKMMENNMIDGLMLVTSLKSSDMILWNPSIRKSLILPRCPFSCTFNDVKYYLGYAPMSNDYRVVAVERADDKALELSIAIYSVGDHLWRVHPNKIKVPIRCFERIQARDGVVFSQGVMYWRPYSRILLEENTHLICFDFDDEKFSYLKLPDIEKDMLVFVFLLGGSLAVLGISHVRSCIWVMDKDAGREPWRQYYSGDFIFDAYEFISNCSSQSLQILYIESSGTLLVGGGKKLMSYNMTSHHIQHLGRSIRCTSVDTYVESLVLHKGSKGATLTSLP